ncbi:hypothetical protein FQN57_001718 [Myotisia sp. PD_48]|nr:hypothetical protein FQN57_001718 [Myotisia sp. PD_48]
MDGRSTSPSMSDTPDDDSLKWEKRSLRCHLGLGPEPGDPPSNSPRIQPLFFIEIAPDSRNGSKCKLPKCDEPILPGDIRLALNPAMSSNSWHESSADFYHIRCFEKIVDFSQAGISALVQPLTRNSWKVRGLKAGTILDGNYLVPGGLERLVLEWKATRGEWIDKRDGVYDEEGNRLDPDFEALLRNAGSSAYQKQTKPEGMPQSEYYNLLFKLAPYESNGPGDTEEWNLFATYLDSSAEALHNPHDLSTMLERWENDTMLAINKEEDLDEVERAAKSRLGGKAIRALQRLSVIPMLQIGLTPFGE